MANTDQYKSSDQPLPPNWPDTDTPQPRPANPHVIKIYTCPLHPEINQPAPGNCPKCDTPLILKEQGEEAT